MILFIGMVKSHPFVIMIKVICCLHINDSVFFMLPGNLTSGVVFCCLLDSFILQIINTTPSSMACKPEALHSGCDVPP